MIVNGKYIQYSEVQSAKIQKEINDINTFNQSVKSNVQDPAKEIEGSSLGFGFSIFQEDESNVSRKQGYGHYREMAQMEFIQRGLEIISNDSTLKNFEGNVIKIFSDNEKIKDALNNLFYERLDLNSELWSIIYETIKMGDNFYEIVPDNYKNPKKIVYIRFLKPENVERIELNGRLLFYTYKTSENREEKEFTYESNNEREDIVYKLQPWQIVHFKIKEDKDDIPYGTSLLKAGVRTFRRLTLLEDIILVYRISRAPERRVFYIDVGNMNYTDSKKFMQKIQSQYRTQNFIDENGNINRKANILSITSDIFVPRKEGGVGTEISTLEGGKGLQTLDDLTYFKNKILRLMNIPPAYLGDEADHSRGSMSQMDLEFSRFIERVATQAFKGIEKIAAIELFFLGYKKEDLNNFKLEPTKPSNISEIVDIDIMSQRMQLISSIKDTGLFDNEWILVNIMKLSQKEISDIKLRKQIQSQNEPSEEEEGGMGMGMGADMDMGAEAPEGAEGVEAPEGAEAPEGIPPASPAPAPEESTLNKEKVITEALVQVLGKDFIIKENKDFFKMMKYLKEDRKQDVIPLFEDLSEMIRQPVRRKNKKRTKEITKQFIIGEMNGLIFNSNKKKEAIKLYEGTGENAKEKKIFLN